VPEIDFFAECEDEYGIVRRLFDRGFQLVPDLTYDTPVVLEAHDWDAYCSLRPGATHFFLMSDDTTRSPLVTYQIPGSGWNAGKYAIRQRHGGPSLSMSLYQPYDQDGIQWLPTCSISFYATYRNSFTGEDEKTPESLKMKYRDIAKYIRTNAKLVEQACIDGGTRKYWIMGHAQAAIRNGARLGVRGLEDLQL
jgi:hypothetical protein